MQIWPRASYRRHSAAHQYCCICWHRAMCVVSSLAGKSISIGKHLAMACFVFRRFVYGHILYVQDAIFLLTLSNNILEICLALFSCLSTAIYTIFADLSYKDLTQHHLCYIFRSREFFPSSFIHYQSPRSHTLFGLHLKLQSWLYRAFSHDVTAAMLRYK